MKIKFNRDFKPFKKGQELEIKTTAEKKYAEYYINNQIAHEVVCDCEDDEQECKGCQGKANKQTMSAQNLTAASTNKSISTDKTTAEKPEPSEDNAKIYGKMNKAQLKALLTERDIAFEENAVNKDLVQLLIDNESK